MHVPLFLQGEVAQWSVTSHSFPENPAGHAQ